MSWLRMDSGRPPIPVAIAGAGPTGLTLALALARRGVRSIVFESKSEPSAYSRAILVPTRTLEIFAELGLLDEALRQGAMRTTLTLFDAASSRVLVRIPFDDLREVAAEAGMLFLPQDRTERILLAAVRATGLCDVRFGSSVRRFAQDTEGVDVWSDGSEPPLRARFLAGCDGARSAVRDGLGLPLVGKTYQTRLLLADVRLNTSADIPTPRLAVRARGPLVLLQFDPDRWRVIGTLLGTETDEHATSAEGIGERIRLLAGNVAFDTQWTSTFHIHSRTAPSFRQGYVFLAGDAAHLSSPAGGMGMNSGIEDAHNLAWKLARVLAGGDSDALLRSYDEERRSAVVSTVERVSDIASNTLYFAPPLVRLASMAAFRALVQIPFARRRLLGTFGMLNNRYPGSAIITGKHRLVGRLAPNCPLRSGGRLFDTAPRRPAIVAYAVRAPEVDQFDRILIADDETAFRRAWRVRRSFCAVVRPDGYIAWAADRPTSSEIAAAARQSLGNVG